MMMIRRLLVATIMLTIMAASNAYTMMDEKQRVDFGGVLPFYYEFTYIYPIWSYTAHIYLFKNNKGVYTCFKYRQNDFDDLDEVTTENLPQVITKVFFKDTNFLDEADYNELFDYYLKSCSLNKHENNQQTIFLMNCSTMPYKADMVPLFDEQYGVKGKLFPISELKDAYNSMKENVDVGGIERLPQYLTKKDTFDFEMLKVLFGSEYTLFDLEQNKYLGSVPCVEFRV